MFTLFVAASGRPPRRRRRIQLKEAQLKWISWGNNQKMATNLERPAPQSQTLYFPIQQSLPSLCAHAINAAEIFHNCRIANSNQELGIWKRELRIRSQGVSVFMDATSQMPSKSRSIIFCYLVCTASGIALTGISLWDMPRNGNLYICGKADFQSHALPNRVKTRATTNG